MAARFVHIEDDTPLLLPPDLRDWVEESHMVHFIMDAVAALDLSPAKINERGTGSEQYPPGTMLALLIYCYATGTFSSRRIETLTYENVATHPDHDSICKFRKETIEPVFGIIKEVMGFRRFLMRGEDKVGIEFRARIFSLQISPSPTDY